MTDWKENERKQIIQALNRIADNLERIEKKYPELQESEDKEVEDDGEGNREDD